MTDEQPTPEKREQPQPIENEMKRAFIDYSMSVIMSRALPDVRDGLKPVHRRILFGMNEMGLGYEKTYKKSARIVGDVLGKYHPHGDQAVYDSLVRMAQDFSLRYPLVAGQGNFGCFTKDTKVALTDGRNLSFDELIIEDKEGKKNYTFTINKRGTVEIAEIKSPRLTKKQQKIVKIVLDNNEEIRCTLNHKFMLRDETYKEAQYLTTEDSLMPLYLKPVTEKNTGKFFQQEYQLLYQSPVLNHKIKEIIFLNEREDVYDLTIDNTHNFALSAGVFVHNSVDGDSAAAMRYTEIKMAKITRFMLQDIDKETVQWHDNFDGSLKEPAVLPAVLPNLLLNGSSGIAVGMATNMAPHNLCEVIDGVIRMIDDPEISTASLMEIIKGPDFPTGGIIYGREGILNAYSTGRGLVRIRAKTHIEEAERKRIIVTEIPFMVNKSNLLKAIAELVKDKKIEGISDLRDESDRKGMRIVIDLKRDAIEDVVLNQLFEHTELQSTFGVLNLAIVNGAPKVLMLKEILQQYIMFRVEIITKRTSFDLMKAKEKMHILEGLLIALRNIDEVIKIIRHSKEVEEAKTKLMQRFKLSEIQVKAILDMRLQKLTGMEIESVEKDYNETKLLIEQLQEILNDKQKILNEIKRELLDIKERFGDARRTEIVDGEIGIEIEDLIPKQEVIITITETGYIKRTPVDTYRTQHRGGKGVIGMKTKEEDLVVDCFTTSTHDYIMFFTNRGQVYWLKGYRIPEGDRHAKGKAIINLLPRLSEGEKIAVAIPVHEFDDTHYLVFATKKGLVKKTSLSAYGNIRVNGIRAIELNEGDEIINVVLSDGERTIMMASAGGQAVRFTEKEIRPMGRTAHGVIGMRLKKKDDAVVAMADVDVEGSLITVTENGFGKRSPIEEYRKTHRGSTGVRTIVTNDRNGKVIFVSQVIDENELIFTTKLGMTVRIPMKDLRSQGRNTMGVRIMRLNEGDRVVSITKVLGESETCVVEGAIEEKSPIEPIEASGEIPKEESKEPSPESSSPSKETAAAEPLIVEPATPTPQEPIVIKQTLKTPKTKKAIAKKPVSKKSVGKKSKPKKEKPKKPSVKKQKPKKMKKPAPKKPKIKPKKPAKKVMKKVKSKKQKNLLKGKKIIQSVKKKSKKKK